MRIAIDKSPLNRDNLAQHKVRGSGTYIRELINNMSLYDNKNSYTVIENKSVPLSGFDLVHYPYFEPFFLSLPLRVKIPAIVTVHDLIPLVFPKMFPVGVKGRLKWEIQKQALKNKNLIVTDSESSKKDIVKITSISPKKIRVVPLAASKVFRKKTKERRVLKKYNLPGDFILYVGDATWNKNLVRIAEAVKKTNTNIVMVGKALGSENYDKKNAWNKELASFQEIIKNDNHFFLPGFVENEDLNDLYNLANIFLMPSLYEGFGLPVLEAMQAGCPVITSKLGSLEEVGGDAPRYVDANDSDSIAKGIEELLDNKRVLEEMSEKGLKQAKQFTWEKFVTDMEKVYEDVFI